MTPEIRVVIVAVATFLLNLPFGAWRAGLRKFSFLWVVAIHLPVLFIIPLRRFLHVNPWWIPLFIALAVGGQIAGSRLRRPGKPAA